MNYVLLLGRILFSIIFIIKGMEHFSTKAIDFATNMGLFMPSVTVPIAGIVVLLGGLSILLGFRARIGALLIIVFLVPTTFFMHQFWSVEDPHQAMMHNYCFWKNIALIGSALMITYFGSGPMSLSKSCACHKK